MKTTQELEDIIAMKDQQLAQLNGMINGYAFLQQMISDVVNDPELQRKYSELIALWNMKRNP